MSIFQGTARPREFPYDDFEGPGHPCFLCGDPLGSGDIAHWAGSTATIYLHPGCVPSFCREILEDWERVNGFQPRMPMFHRPSSLNGCEEQSL